MVAVNAMQSLDIRTDSNILFHGLALLMSFVQDHVCWSRREISDSETAQGVASCLSHCPVAGSVTGDEPIVDDGALPNNWMPPRLLGSASLNLSRGYPGLTDIAGDDN